jgi:hypothetical protein
MPKPMPAAAPVINTVLFLKLLMTLLQRWEKLIIAENLADIRGACCDSPASICSGIAHQENPDFMLVIGGSSPALDLCREKTNSCST